MIMTNRGFQIEFERRLQLMDPNLVIKDKLSSDTIISFINEAIDKFYKTRYSGISLIPSAGKSSILVGNLTQVISTEQLLLLIAK